MNLVRADSEDYDRVYLALLCQCPAREPRRAELEALLARHSWRSADHRVVFEALSGWRADPKAIRNGLAARITRLGFPDMEIEPYFAPITEPLETALYRLREELAATPNHPAAPPDRTWRNTDAAASDRRRRKRDAAAPDRAPHSR
jgi:hypothetical protein